LDWEWPALAHENHEVTFMMIPFRRREWCGRMASKDGSRRPQPIPRSIVMKWETPQAIDFRFGMEITMYIAKR